jgi:MerR family transcriptional regulator/heat shock protein HspR
MQDDERTGKGRASGPVKAVPVGLREEYVLIGVVAKRFGVHPRRSLYERRAVRPACPATPALRPRISRLEIILTLTRDLGVNLAGVEVILDLRTRLARMEGEVGRMMEAIRAVARDRANPSTNALALRPKTALAIRYE